MGKTAKKIKYIDGNLPEKLGELLAKADESDLKILIALMMAADENGVVDESFSVSSALGLERTEVAAAIKFWRGAGFIETAGATDKAPKEDTAKKTDTPAKKEDNKKKSGEVTTAHRDGALETSHDMDGYRSAELADILEQRQVSYEFIEEAQRVFGKTFNSYDTGIVVSLVDRLGFEEAAVLSILAYMTRIGKRGLRYTEKVAMGFYDDGYTTAKEVEAHIAAIERSKETVYKVKQLFGATNRELSKSEKSMFEKWTMKLDYDIDVIRIAYDITIDVKHEPIPKYTGAILENWYNLGLRTADEVRAHESSKKESRDTKSKSESADKSYDIDDFFDAALKRTFDDLK